MKKVAVLLSTYNGEKYVKQQIESILKQTYDEITLIIRDDGSTDNTMEVLENIQHSNKTRKKIDFMKDDMGNLGYGKSFCRLIMYAEGYDYYAFCDQDDYWLEDKVASAVRKMEHTDENRCVLYASNYYVCNENLDIKGTWADDIDLSGLSLGQIFMEGKVAGFTLLFNNELRKKAFMNGNVENIVSHDKWLSLVVKGLEQIFIYDTNPHAYYRRHGNTASPANQTISERARWRLTNVLKGQYVKQLLDMVKIYSENYYDLIKSESDRKFLKVFCDKTFAGNLSRAFYNKRLRTKFCDEICLRILLLITKA